MQYLCDKDIYILSYVCVIKHMIFIPCDRSYANCYIVYDWFQRGVSLEICQPAKRTPSANYSKHRLILVDLGRGAKYGGRRRKSSVPRVNPWCLVFAVNTPKLPQSRMACCCRAHAQIPVVVDAVEDVL